MFLVPRNQRSSMRHAIQLPCQVVRERDFKMLSDRTLDLSPDGMRVKTHQAVRVGDKLIVSFKAPTDVELWFDTEATVRRIEKGRRPKDNGRAIGVEFGPLSQVARLILRGSLRKVPPPVPRRAHRIDYAATIANI
jgi:hypothetical protein